MQRFRCRGKRRKAVLLQSHDGGEKNHAFFGVRGGRLSLLLQRGRIEGEEGNTDGKKGVSWIGKGRPMEKALIHHRADYEKENVASAGRRKGRSPTEARLSVCRYGRAPTVRREKKRRPQSRWTRRKDYSTPQREKRRFHVDTKSGHHLSKRLEKRRAAPISKRRPQHEMDQRSQRRNL